MDLICAVDRNWNLGRDNDLLFYIGEDLARFKSLTLGQTVVMGRLTLESLPGGRPLAGRQNIVLSSKTDYRGDNLTSYRSVEDFLEDLPSIKGQVYLIGGGSLINQLVDHCDYAYITQVDSLVSDAHVFMESLDEKENFRLVSQSPSYYQGDLSYKYVKYENIGKKRV